MSRSRSTARRPKSSKKTRSVAVVPKTMVILALTVLVVFAGGLYYIATHKPAGSSPEPTNQRPKTNTLPPKPEERWRYIKELENRPVGVTNPVEPSSGSQSQKPEQLTTEQRRYLEQIQSDMKQPAQMRGKPEAYNPPQPEKPKQQKTTVVPQNVAPVKTQTSTAVPVQPTKTVTAAPSSQPAKTTSAPASQKPAASEQKTAAVSEKSSQRWLLQCGSFRNLEQAETVKAQLAFSGVEGYISSSDGWHRILLGPYSNRANAVSTQQRAKGAGVSGCIIRASGG